MIKTLKNEHFFISCDSVAVAGTILTTFYCTLHLFTPLLIWPSFSFPFIFSITAGHSSAGASSGQSLLRCVVPTMDPKRRDIADLRYVIWCCVNLRPDHMRYDDGFQLFVGRLSPEYVNTMMAPKTFDKNLDILRDRVKANAVDDLRTSREGCLALGYSGAFLGAQLDVANAAGEEYITFSVSYVRKGSSDVTRVALATRAFPGTHTADDVRPWIEAVRRFVLPLLFCSFWCCLPGSGGC